MSVDWEFRDKNKPWLSTNTPTTSQLKKIFLSRKSRYIKVKSYPNKKNFSVDCGNGCWIHIYDVKGYPLIKMLHFDHYEQANNLLQDVAKLYGCVVLNDLEHGETDVWAGKPGSLQSSSEKPSAPLTRVDKLSSLLPLSVRPRKKSCKSIYNHALKTHGKIPLKCLCKKK